jgi:hypothetical protein
MASVPNNWSELQSRRTGVGVQPAKASPQRQMFRTRRLEGHEPGCVNAASGDSNTGTRMRLLSFAYRFLTNFVFLATVYLSLNYIEKYNNRAILAIAILIYGALRAASALRSFYFFQRIERLEAEARRLVALFAQQGAQSPMRKETIADVSLLRRDGEIKSYIDLFFLAAVVLLCVAKIVASD